jgi:hypothetical protein
MYRRGFLRQYVALPQAWPVRRKTLYSHRSTKAQKIQCNYQQQVFITFPILRNQHISTLAHFLICQFSHFLIFTFAYLPIFTFVYLLFIYYIALQKRIEKQ